MQAEPADAEKVSRYKSQLQNLKRNADKFYQHFLFVVKNLLSQLLPLPTRK